MSRDGAPDSDFYCRGRPADGRSELRVDRQGADSWARRAPSAGRWRPLLDARGLRGAVRRPAGGGGTQRLRGRESHLAHGKRDDERHRTGEARAGLSWWPVPPRRRRRSARGRPGKATGWRTPPWQQGGHGVAGGKGVDVGGGQVRAVVNAPAPSPRRGRRRAHDQAGYRAHANRVLRHAPRPARRVPGRRRCMRAGRLARRRPSGVRRAGSSIGPSVEVEVFRGAGAGRANVRAEERVSSVTSPARRSSRASCWTVSPYPLLISTVPMPWACISATLAASSARSSSSEALQSRHGP